MAAPTEFSFEKDIAPYASRFFDEIGSNPNLSQGTKSRLQGKLLGGVMDLEAQRLQLQEERMKGRLQSLQYQNGVSAIEEARARRLRIQDEESRRNTVHQEVRGIIDSDQPVSVKRQLLADAELNSAGLNDPAIRSIFDAGRNVLPEPAKRLFTPAQEIDYRSKGVPQEVIDSGDTGAIGAYLEEGRALNEERADERRIQREDDRELRKEKQSLLNSSLRFAEPTAADEENNTWLIPESTQLASRIVDVFGTPDERERFEALRTDSSDRERAEMVRAIQSRERLAIIRRDKQNREPSASERASQILGPLR